MAVDDNAFAGDGLDLEALGDEIDRALAGAEAPAGSRAAEVDGMPPVAPRPVVSQPAVEPVGRQVGAEPLQSVQRVRFAPLVEDPSPTAGPSNISFLLDVNLKVSVELGRATMSVRDTLNLAPGHVVELDKLAGDPVDILVNGRLIAKGEVVVVDDQFGVRITEIVSARQRVEAMR